MFKQYISNLVTVQDFQIN